MFSVEAIVSRGWFRDKLLIAALDDIRHSRRRLGWDHAGAPEVTMDMINVVKGEEFVVSLPKGRAAVGQTFSLEQVSDSPAFERLWKPVAPE